MWNSDQQDSDDEDLYQNDVIDDHEYEFLEDSHGSSSQLEEFRNEWRDEIHRKQNILRLNDDCFYKIFSYLPANDLCALSETCRDFRRLSHWYFERYSHSFRFDWSFFYAEPLSNLWLVSDSQKISDFSFKEQWLRFSEKWRNFHFFTKIVGIKLTDAKRFFRNFGQYLTKLSLKNSDFQNDGKQIRLLALVDRYCNALQDLEIDISSKPVNFTQYERLHTNLLRLAIFNHVEVRGQFPAIEVDLILAQFVLLEHLELRKVNWVLSPEVAVPKCHEKLESFSLINVLIPSAIVLKAFLNENHQLKRVKFSDCVYSIKSRYNGNTAITLPNLESLWLQLRYDILLRGSLDIQPHAIDISGDVRLLKSLLIDFKDVQKSNFQELLARLAAHNVIEFFTICNLNELSNGTVSHLCALTNLKNLLFDGVKGFNVGIIKNLACGLPKLTCIGFNIDDFDFNLLEHLMEFSHNLNTIAVQRKHRSRSPERELTKKLFLSLVKARLRNKHSTEQMILLLDRQSASMNDEWTHVINVQTRY